MSGESGGASVSINGIPVSLKNLTAGQVLGFDGKYWINTTGGGGAFPDITDTTGVLVTIGTPLQVIDGTANGSNIYNSPAGPAAVFHIVANDSTAGTDNDELRLLTNNDSTVYSYIWMVSNVTTGSSLILSNWGGNPNSYLLFQNAAGRGLKIGNQNGNPNLIGTVDGATGNIQTVIDDGTGNASIVGSLAVAGKTVSLSSIYAGNNGSSPEVLWLIANDNYTPVVGNDLLIGANTSASSIIDLLHKTATGAQITIANSVGVDDAIKIFNNSVPVMTIGNAAGNPSVMTSANNTLDDGAGKIIPVSFRMVAGAGAGLVLSSDASGNGTWAALLSNALTVTSANSSIIVSQVLTNIDLALNLTASHLWTGIQHLPSLSGIHSANTELTFTEIEAAGAVNGVITNDINSFGNTDSTLKIMSDQSATNYLQLGNGAANLNAVITANNVIDDGIGNTARIGYNSINMTQTTTPGDSGNAIWSQPEQGSSYKKVAIYLDAFVSSGGTDLTFPTAFTNTPFIYGTVAATALCAVIASKVTVTNSGGGVTGWIFLEGY